MSQAGMTEDVERFDPLGPPLRRIALEHRARYRLLLSHPLAGPVYGSGDGEVLAEWRDQASMSYRLSGSVGAFLNPRLRLQVGYTHLFLPGGRHDERIRVLLLYNTGAGHKTAEP